MSDRHGSFLLTAKKSKAGSCSLHANKYDMGPEYISGWLRLSEANNVTQCLITKEEFHNQSEHPMMQIVCSASCAYAWLQNSSGEAATTEAVDQNRSERIDFLELQHDSDSKLLIAKTESGSRVFTFEKSGKETYFGTYSKMMSCLHAMGLVLFTLQRF